MDPQDGKVFLKYGDTIGKDSPIEGIKYEDRVYLLVHPAMLAKFEEHKENE